MRAVQQDVDGGECHQGFGGCEARRRRIKPAQKSCLYRREEKKKRRRFQQWSGFKFFLFYSRFNNCVGDIGWENMADE